MKSAAWAASVGARLGAACLLGLACGMPLPVAAQNFFTNGVVEATIGTDRGSASRLPEVDAPTRILVGSNEGSDVSGRAVLGFGLALPDTLMEGDQLDLSLAWAGPSDDGWRELLAGGVGYRAGLGEGEAEAYATLDYGNLILGTAEALALDARGDRWQVAVGLRRDIRLDDLTTLRLGIETAARRTQSEVLGVPQIDEDLRILRASIAYERGIPFVFGQRVSLAFAQGLKGFGASQTGALEGSVPGSATDFSRMSFAIEGLVPLSDRWRVSAGIIGQYTRDSLPQSQRCGFATNAYARGFDLSDVTGDRCLGGRIEVARILQMPRPGAEVLKTSQVFLGLDGGRLDNLGNAFLPGAHERWSSLSLGLRVLRGDFLGEIAATQVLEAPPVAGEVSDRRLWLRGAWRF